MLEYMRCLQAARDRKGTHVLSILVHGATSHRPYECNCLETAFTFQALNMVESFWFVDPSSVDGMTQGMDDHYGRCGWGDSGGLASSFNEQLDEFRALATHETGSDNRLFHIKDSFADKCPAGFGPTH
ncbi:BQ5605_C003g02240 [Microbotryum silenes-dioicae]|uniref:BQ5605_C003g02240 protein n=1 Tax=Microbotryum silenes-dioicae TaxID=796604 RepID=A0A2X0P3Q8_9BASI|nr:BQ5605_C003g02240 [Microbotryum silenes-dioicae]